MGAMPETLAAPKNCNEIVNPVDQFSHSMLLNKTRHDARFDDRFSDFVRSGLFLG